MFKILPDGLTDAVGIISSIPLRYAQTLGFQLAVTKHSLLSRRNCDGLRAGAAR